MRTGCMDKLNTVIITIIDDNNLIKKNISFKRYSSRK